MFGNSVMVCSVLAGSFGLLAYGADKIKKRTALISAVACVAVFVLSTLGPLLSS